MMENETGKKIWNIFGKILWVSIVLVLGMLVGHQNKSCHIECPEIICSSGTEEVEKCISMVGGESVIRRTCLEDEKWVSDIGNSKCCIPRSITAPEGMGEHLDGE